MSIDFEDFKDFTHEENAESTQSYFYTQTKDMDTARKYFKEFSGGDSLDDEIKNIEDFEVLVGLELALEIENESGEVICFTYSPVSFDTENGGYSSYDPRDVNIFSNEEVLKFVKKACSDKDR